MSNLDLGLVTAYGYAKSQGYSDTEENFAIELANVKTYRDDAEDAAELAEQYKDEAFSGTPTGYEQLVSDVYSLETEEDTVLTQAETFVGRVLLDKMHGMSSQATTPTPSSPVDIKSAKTNFKECGKNLIDASYATEGVHLTYTVNNDKSVTINGNPTSATVINFSYDHPFISHGEIVKLSGCPEDAPQGVTMRLLDITDSSNVINQHGEPVSFQTVSGHKYCIRFYSNANTTIDNLTIYPMLTLADADQTFEPYQGQSVTTDLVLRAIEVTSSDNYNLVKDGHYYVADTLEKIDGGYQITRRVDEIAINGSENWIGSQTNYYYYNIPDKHAKYAVTSISNKSLSTNFVNCGSDSALRVWGGFAIGDISNVLQLVIYDRNHAQNANAEALKTWLASALPKFYYVMAIPTTESISNADAKKLLSLKSYDEATYVAQTEDTEGVMVLKYGSTELSNMAVTGYVEGELNSIRLSDLESAV